MVRPRSDGERQVLEAVADLEAWRAPTVAAHPTVEIGERQVFNILNALAERGLLARE